MEKLSLVSTASTMLLCLPILWWNFGRISLIGLVSNVLVLPLVPPLMILGVGMLVLPDFLYLPTYALAHLLVRIIEFFGV
jgi:predicted membrane metal-binding protein